jgi:hypothetical protein
MLEIAEVLDIRLIRAAAFLSLAWHHTRSFRQRSRAEGEQSYGSVARSRIIFGRALDDGGGAVFGLFPTGRISGVSEFESSYPSQPV